MDKYTCQWTAIEGLGGVGKTQMTLEATFRVGDQHPNCSVSWVPAVDLTSFENAYREIGQRLQVLGIEEDGADIKLLVKNAMSQETCGSWLLIIDNADNVELLFSTAILCDYLPFSLQGSILFTAYMAKTGMSTEDQGRWHKQRNSHYAASIIQPYFTG
ncbi:uncharacterized protein Z518_01244 [Rhinocladiella mackenziei CBS 650.93]|uniref:Rhinocladiella mackenziei CBS 650.93 unplaced genomic scaffold supercont1.1, whole genome shotgun sequence n=1 Tax=Rhinocladiella mackenziei CBS 650.93 TaxID=1442369 RepID=A0A0D2HHL2_9EURO|nr:uncharacterized protein Z518_01244 [Rhinocladiella mackenziei CBS 650.93]KIX10163.1 hypothetical protein Z518_01244 [Rhinocladiella mackenziei CBS 650.93]